MTGIAAMRARASVTSACAFASAFFASAASAAAIALVACFRSPSWKVISWSNRASTTLRARLRDFDVEIDHRIQSAGP